MFCLIALLHVGSVRKQEDPIVMTQTNPIAYKDKMEEIKDGEKGAPSPTYKYYPKGRFLVEPPMEKEPEESLESGVDQIPDWGEPIPEDLEMWEDESFEQKDSSKYEEEPKIEGDTPLDQPNTAGQAGDESREDQDWEWWQEEETPQEGQNLQ
ncbi:MAG TPA: hypothetical protein VD913_05445 [bacterium]|nr:hypothetical protein [bacterium]